MKKEKNYAGTYSDFKKIANFETFWRDKNFGKNLLFLKSEKSRNFKNISVVLYPIFIHILWLKVSMGTQEMPESAFMNVVQRISLVENYLDMLDATRIKVNYLLCILFHLRIVTGTRKTRVLEVLWRSRF